MKFELQDETITIEALFESMPVAMALLDREGRHVALNQELAAFSGLTARELLGTKVELQSKESGENSRRDFRFFDAGKEVPDHELRLGDRVLLVSVRPVRNAFGFAVGEMVALSDITEQKEMERQLACANERLRVLASYDALTEVLNARTFYEVCDRMMVSARRERQDFSLLFLDLDHFKAINDSWGHDAGDLVLKSAAAAIVASCREGDAVGRVGGEEFAVFLPDTAHEGGMVLAEKIRLNIERLDPTIAGSPRRVTASVGVCSAMDHHKSVSDIQRDADHAMYHAKKSGRNRVACLSRPCYLEADGD